MDMINSSTWEAEQHSLRSCAVEPECLGLNLSFATYCMHVAMVTYPLRIVPLLQNPDDSGSFFRRLL